MIRTNLAAAMCILAAATTANASLVQFQASLSGDQEVPAVSTTGQGQAYVTLDTDTNKVFVQGSFANLLAPATMAHLHGLAGPGQTAPPIINLILTPQRQGIFVGEARLSSDLIEGLLNGLTYVNVHSSMFPAGEIRGQVVAHTPAPAGLALLGLGAMTAHRRRPRVMA